MKRRWGQRRKLWNQIKSSGPSGMLRSFSSLRVAVPYVLYYVARKRILQPCFYFCYDSACFVGILAQIMPVPSVSLVMSHWNCNVRTELSRAVHHGSSLPNIQVIHSRVYVKRGYIVCTNSISHRAWDMLALSCHPLSSTKVKGVVFKGLRVQGEFSKCLWALSRQ